jgi:hypothetical protein
MTNWISGPNGQLGQPTPGGAEAFARAPVGSIARFFDADGGGEGEFIYLPGVLNTANGDLVEYEIGVAPAVAPLTVRHSNATASNSGRPVAVAVAAAGAGQYTWYQIGGLAVVNAVAGAVAGPMFGTGTAGSVGSAADAGDQIIGARIASAVGVPSAGKVYAQLSRPHVQGQIT